MDLLFGSAQAAGFGVENRTVRQKPRFFQDVGLTLVELRKPLNSKKPKGSKNPIFKDPGSNSHTLNGFLGPGVLKYQVLGPAGKQNALSLRKGPSTQILGIYPKPYLRFLI